MIQEGIRAKEHQTKLRLKDFADKDEEKRSMGVGD